MLNIKEKILENWRLLNIAIILSFFSGLTFFTIKAVGYPRILTDFILSLKEFAGSFFYAFVYVFPVLFLVYIAFIINKRVFYIIISSAFSLAVFGGIGYFLNRVVFSDLFKNKTLIGGVKVRLVYVTAKSLIPNIILLISFFLFTYFLYRWLAVLGKYLAGKKFKKQYDRNILFSGKITLVFAFFFLGLIIIFLAVMFLLPGEIEADPAREQVVYLIGLDGADWRILDPLINDGKMPTLKKLIDTGCRANLLAPASYVQSGPSWSSIGTGLTPAQHGIKSNSGYVRDPRVWNILDHAGFKSIVVNWLCSPFAEKIKGTFITGPYDSPASYPVKLLPFLERKFGRYYSDVDSREISDAFIESCFHVTEQRIKIVNYLTGQVKPNLLAAIFTSSDRLMHFMWQYYEPGKFEFNVNEGEKERFSNSIEKYFITFDRHLEEIIKTADPSRTTFVVVSDHGFAALPQKKIFTSDMELNYFLSKIGIYRINRDFQVDKTGLFAEEKSHFGQIRRRITMSGGALAKKLVPMFKSVRVKQDGKHCFKDVSWDGEFVRLQINSSIYGINAVDVIFEYDGKTYEFPLEHFIHRNKLRTGDHRREGVIILSGNKIRKGEVLDDVKVYDVTPTILALFEMPVSFKMAGIPVVEAFSDEFLKRFSWSYIRSYDFIKKKIIRGGKKNNGQSEKLKSLGYLN